MPWLIWSDVSMPRFLRVTSALLCASSLAAAESMPSAFATIPEADVLPHEAFALGGQLGYHRTLSGDASAHNRFPWLTRLDLGLFGLSELGIEVGDAVGLSLKAKVLTADGAWPSVAIGARGLFHSGDAYVRSVEDSLAEQESNEVFVVLSEELPGPFAFHGGLNVESDARGLPFWGLEARIPGNLGLLYEGFWKRGSHHHDLGLRWRFRDAFQLGVGATEFWRWFYSAGAFAFQSSGRDNAKDGYEAPGLYVNVVLVSRRELPKGGDTGHRLSKMETAQDSTARAVRDLKARVAYLEQHLGTSVTARDSLSLLLSACDSLLSEMVLGMQSDSWNPVEGRALGERILALGPAAHGRLVELSRDTARTLELRTASVRVLGMSGSAEYLPLLSPLLFAPELAIRREALYAVGAVPGAQADSLLAQVAVVSPELKEIAVELRMERGTVPRPVAPKVPAKSSVADSSMAKPTTGTPGKGAEKGLNPSGAASAGSAAVPRDSTGVGTPGAAAGEAAVPSPADSLKSERPGTPAAAP